MRYQIVALLFILRLARAESMPMEAARPMVDLTIVTNNGAKAKEFYGNVLGLKPLGSTATKDGGEITRYQVGTGSIRIIAAAKAAPKHAGGIDGGIGIRGVALFLPDADRVVKSMASHGLPEPKFITGKTAAKLVRLTDPDGNWIELIFPGPAAQPEVLNQMAIILMVKDEAKSREFYGKTLGIPETAPHGKPETGLLYAYTAGKSTVLVKGLPNKPSHTGKVMDAVGYRSIRFTVKNLDALAKSLQESGAPIPMPPDERNGERTMYVADPDGNYLEFVAAK